MVVLKFEYYRSDYAHVENRIFLDRVYHLDGKIQIFKKTKEYNPETGRLRKEILMLIPRAKFIQIHEEYSTPEGILYKIHLIYPELKRICTIEASNDMLYPQVNCKHLDEKINIAKEDFDEADEIDALDLLRLPIELAP